MKVCSIAKGLNEVEIMTTGRFMAIIKTTDVNATYDELVEWWKYWNE